MKTISKTKAVELAENSKGKFITVVYLTKDGSIERKLNGQYLKSKNPSKLGYFLMKEAIKLKKGEERPIRNINANTLKYIKVNKEEYKVR